MTLKELIEQYSYQNEGVYTLIDIENLCKEYAKICLEKAANEVQIRMEFSLSFGEPSVYYVKETEQNNYNLSIDKSSILNIELP